MKKLKKSIAALAILAFGCVFMFNTQTSQAEEESLHDWVCCQSLSDGCVTIDGMMFPDDYKKYAPNCDEPIQN